MAIFRALHNMENENRKILRGAGTVSMGAFASKVIGAIYRIPLTNILGGKGIGLYQLVFPVYCLLLDFSGAAAPNAVARLVARKENKSDASEKIFAVSLNLFLLFGGVCAALLALFCKPIAALQGEPSAFSGFAVISPAVVVVSAIACFRGYFQGEMDMRPTAVSQIIEQLAKLAVGLSLAWIFKGDLTLSVCGALFGVTAAEVVALIYLRAKFKKRCLNPVCFSSIEKSERKSIAKEVIKTSVPITLLGLFIPFSQFIDSFLIVNALSEYSREATSLYGLYSGSAATLINLPVSLLYGIATVAVPSISSCEREESEKKTKILLAITLVAGAVCSFLLFVFSPFAVNVLYKGLTTEQRTTTIKIIKLLCVNAVFLPLLQTENSVLIGYGLSYLPLVGLTSGVAVKTVMEIFLLKLPEFNIYGACLSLIACYFVASLINLFIVKKGGAKFAYKTNIVKKLDNIQ